MLLFAGGSWGFLASVGGGSQDVEYLTAYGAKDQKKAPEVDSGAWLGTYF